MVVLPVVLLVTTPELDGIDRSLTDGVVVFTEWDAALLVATIGFEIDDFGEDAVGRTHEERFVALQK